MLPRHAPSGVFLRDLITASDSLKEGSVVRRKLCNTNAGHYINYVDFKSATHEQGVIETYSWHLTLETGHYQFSVFSVGVLTRYN